MTRSRSVPAADFRQIMLETYAVNERVNQLLLEHLDSQAWRAKPPGRKGRTIAAIFAHVHNTRCKWLRLSAPYLKSPGRLDPARCTQEQVRTALAKSAACCSEMIADALAGPEKRVKKFRRDGWAKAWPPGVAMFTYMVSHEAHHRGQVAMLAHQQGFQLPIKAAFGIWNWEKLWKECGFTHPR